MLGVCLTLVLPKQSTRICYLGKMGVCALCFSPPGGRGGLHVDHCHATGAVRALLCSDCNTGLGLLKDSPALLRDAARYVELYQTPKERNQNRSQNLFQKETENQKETEICYVI